METQIADREKLTLASVLARSAAARDVRSIGAHEVAPAVPAELASTIRELKTIVRGDQLSAEPNFAKLAKSRASVAAGMQELVQQQRVLADSPISASACVSPRSPQPVPQQIAKGIKRRNVARGKFVKSVDNYQSLLRDEHVAGYRQALQSLTTGLAANARPAKRARTASASRDDDLYGVDTSDDDGSGDDDSAGRPAKRARKAPRKETGAAARAYGDAKTALACLAMWQGNHTHSVVASKTENAMNMLRLATARAFDVPGEKTRCAIKDALHLASDAIDLENALRQPDHNPLDTFPRNTILTHTDRVRGILTKELAKGAQTAKEMEVALKLAQDYRPWLDAEPPDASKLRDLRKHVNVQKRKLGMARVVLDNPTEDDRSCAA